MSHRLTPSYLLATGLGAGYLPLVPGTWGSLESLLLIWIVHHLVPAAHEVSFLWFLLAFFVVGGILSSTRVARREKDTDPSQVVVDEIAGQIVTLIAVPLTASNLISGFILFRVFDILKIFPARQAESLHGGWGIMLDDLIAGVQAGVLLYIVNSLRG
ncbi:MAG: phosphatidylglycerophosphatase A [Acidobacteriota bacterium]